MSHHPKQKESLTTILKLCGVSFLLEFQANFRLNSSKVTVNRGKEEFPGNLFQPFQIITMTQTYFHFALLFATTPKCPLVMLMHSRRISSTFAMITQKKHLNLSAMYLMLMVVSTILTRHNKIS